MWGVGFFFETQNPSYILSFKILLILQDHCQMLCVSDSLFSFLKFMLSLYSFRAEQLVNTCYYIYEILPLPSGSTCSLCIWNLKMSDRVLQTLCSPWYLGLQQKNANTFCSLNKEAEAELSQVVYRRGCKRRRFWGACLQWPPHLSELWRELFSPRVAMSRWDNYIWVPQAKILKGIVSPDII